MSMVFKAVLYGVCIRDLLSIVRRQHFLSTKTHNVEGE